MVILSPFNILEMILRAYKCLVQTQFIEVNIQ